MDQSMNRKESFFFLPRKKKHREKKTPGTKEKMFAFFFLSPENNFHSIIWLDVSRD